MRCMMSSYDMPDAQSGAEPSRIKINSTAMRLIIDGCLIALSPFFSIGLLQSAIYLTHCQVSPISYHQCIVFGLDIRGVLGYLQGFALVGFLTMTPLGLFVAAAGVLTAFVISGIEYARHISRTSRNH